MRSSFNRLRLDLGLGNTHNKGGDALAAWIGASTYADWSAKRLDRMYQESTEVTPVAVSADKVGSWNSLTGGFTAKNATAAQRLNLLISGTRYTLTGDGSDDNLLTTWLAASGGNTIFFDLSMPSSGSFQLVFGGQDGASTNRFQFGLNPSSGLLGFGVGVTSPAAFLGTTDFRGQRCVGAVTHDGTNTRIFTLTGGQEAVGAQSGVPTTTTPARIGAGNANGNAANWFSGGIARIIPVQKGGLTLSDWQLIGPQLAAAGA